MKKVLRKQRIGLVPPTGASSGLQPAGTAIPIPTGAFDTQLDAGRPGTSGSRQRPASAEHQVSADPALLLPVGARVLLRKSGGLQFVSQDILVDRHRWATRSTTDAPEAKRTRLTFREMKQLEQSLRQLVLAGVPCEVPRQNPDAYVYELVFRLAWRRYACQVADGGIPPSVGAVIRELQQLTWER